MPIIKKNVDDYLVGGNKISGLYSEEVIEFILQELVPSGTVITFAGSAAPLGWMLCDGSEVGRAEFANLFEVIGTTYGVGDGVNTLIFLI